MSKTRFVLLIALFAAFASAVYAQTPVKVTVTVALVDKELNLKPVPKFPLTVRSSDDKAVSVTTSFEGTAEVALAPGNYTIRSAKPLEFDGSSYSWDHAFIVEPGKTGNIELSGDNANVAEAAPVRRVSREGELFETLRNGVVTIQGELMSGTGFIFDDKGLVLTNARVIAATNDIRVRFDRYTAVRARLLARMKSATLPCCR